MQFSKIKAHIVLLGPLASLCSRVHDRAKCSMCYWNQMDIETRIWVRHARVVVAVYRVKLKNTAVGKPLYVIYCWMYFSNNIIDKVIKEMFWHFLATFYVYLIMLLRVKCKLKVRIFDKGACTLGDWYERNMLGLR